jgi:hypothetical protein
MDRSAAGAYVYAKASGMLAKSYVGSRAVRLFSVKSLGELWTLLFRTEVPAVPEVLLARQIEDSAQRQFLEQFINLLDNYTKPDDVLVSLLRFYDYDNLKDLAAALCYRESKMPMIADIHQYTMLHYNKWPDLASITAGSPVSWYNKAPEAHEQQAADAKLDVQYVKDVWRSVQKLPAGVRKPVRELIREELSIQNALWAIRLRVYYKMDADEIPARLAYADESHPSDDVLAGEALSILHKDTGSWDDWKDWKYARDLNPHEEGVVWEIDPRWIERIAKIRLNEHALKAFHKYPFTAMVLVSWFKIKQNELDCIRTVAEGLRLNVEQSQVMNFAGVSRSNQA